MEVDPLPPELKEENGDPTLRDVLGSRGIPLPQELMYREMGINSHKRRRCVVGKKFVSDTLASTADTNLVACSKKLNTMTKFKLPTGARTTFHMAFSGDGSLVASCHGDHNVYVCEIKTGKVVRTLSGHPRTPWCVVFHPTQSDILASGCLAGHVRVWDLNGGSELFITDSGTVIASLAFHPTVRLLAIGTFNEVIFWDWSRGDIPLARCCTQNTKEKVRLVRFDATGRYLITGITNFPSAPAQNTIHLPSGGVLNHPSISRPSINIFRNLGELDLDPEIQEVLEERQDRFQESYRQLVNHYEDLVQHYHTFLRSRIPRILGSGSGMEEMNMNMSQNSPQPPPSPTVEDDQRPGPSWRMRVNTDIFSRPTATNPISPGISPSAILNMSQSTVSSTSQSQGQNTNGSNPNAAAASSNGNSASAAARREFHSIEALAQNIMEMQNLCSQARQRVRLGPPTMETQHVMELQQIRQHLEVLQDQTRRLQNSIRQTLTSLATGSLAAMRSQEVGHGNGQNNPTSTVTSNSSNFPGPISSSSTSSANSPSLSNIPNPLQVVPPPTLSGSSSSHPHMVEEQTSRPRRSISPSTANSTSFFRISVNNNPDRMRVPPVVRYSDRRILTREFVIDHHSRNCPFNINQQPPAVNNRTRCLIEDEGTIELEPWPTMETGMALSTRSFPGVEQGRNENDLSGAGPSRLHNPADVSLRVFLSVRGGEDVEMSESWQRNFLSGLALVPSSVREGRRGRSSRFRRNLLRSQLPHRLNASFGRSFYIRVDTELVPVYSSHETSGGHEIRDSLGSNVFVFPITVFFNDFDSSQQIGIYWPCMSQLEEEALADIRRYEQPITVYPNQNAAGRRVRVSYDSNSLDMEVGGVRLGIVQPGVQVLEAITNLSRGGTRGVIYVDFLAPLLDGMERYFSQQFLGHSRGSGRRRPPRRIVTVARDNGHGGISDYALVPHIRFSQFHDAPTDDDNRRVLSLAVETAASTASELLINRRPVESRIERVLNSSTAIAGMGSTSRNNGSRNTSNSHTSPGPQVTMSIPSSSGSAFSGMTNQERLDDMQRRINILASRSSLSGGSNGRSNSNATQTSSRRSPDITAGSEEGLIINRLLPVSHPQWVVRRQRRFTNQPTQRPVDSGTSARTRASGRGERNNNEEDEPTRFFQPYISNGPGPEILVTPRATLNGAGMPHVQAVPPPSSGSYYHLDATAATTSFLSSRVQRWDFGEFIVPDISQRNSNLVVRECSLHSDACLDVSKNSEFLAVLQPSDSGAYSSLGVYSLMSENLGELLAVYHFDQNTVSVSVSPSSEFICVGYAGRGPMYRFVQQGNTTGRNIGQILSVRANKNGLLLPVRDLYADSTTGSVMAINCMHFLPVPGLGILFGTNTGDLVLMQ